MKPFEIIKVEDVEIKCDGGKFGHPRVFLHIDKASGTIQCPYCSRLYVLNAAVLNQAS